MTRCRSTPYRCLLGPVALGKLLLEQPRGLRQRGLVTAFVKGHARPVQRFRSDLAGLRIVRKLSILFLGARPVTPRASRVGEAEAELGQEIVRREIALEAVALRAVRIREDEGRRPLRAESLERLRLVFDVNLDGQEVLVDVSIDVRVGISLGIQPSARPSHRGGVEVDQHALTGLLRLAERFIDILRPVDRHFVLLSSPGSSARQSKIAAPVLSQSAARSQPLLQKDIRFVRQMSERGGPSMGVGFRSAADTP